MTLFLLDNKWDENKEKIWTKWGEREREREKRPFGHKMNLLFTSHFSIFKVDFFLFSFYWNKQARHGRPMHSFTESKQNARKLSRKVLSLNLITPQLHILFFHKAKKYMGWQTVNYRSSAASSWVANRIPVTTQLLVTMIKLIYNSVIFSSRIIGG